MITCVAPSMELTLRTQTADEENAATDALLYITVLGIKDGRFIRSQTLPIKKHFNYLMAGNLDEFKLKIHKDLGELVGYNLHMDTFHWGISKHQWKVNAILVFETKRMDTNYVNCRFNRWIRVGNNAGLVCYKNEDKTPKPLQYKEDWFP